MLHKLMNDDELEAYEAGKDTINGANTQNCHFSLFSTPAKTKAWEQGKRDAEMAEREP